MTNKIEQRWDELSAKGWTNLSEEELKELEEINKYFEKMEVAK